MKIYVIHYSKNISRRVDLGLNETWVTEWDKEDTFCKWIKWFTKSPLSESQMSCTLKHIWCLQDMINHKHKEAIILEDDVVLETDWLNKFQKVNKPSECMYIKLGSIFDNIPYNESIYKIGNPGGTEALWITEEFAHVALNNLNFQQSTDIFYGALLLNMGHPLLCIPVCSQTSVFTQDTSINANEVPIYWTEYIKNFKHLKKIKLNELLIIYEEFMKKKKNFESYYNTRFNCQIELNNFDMLH